MPSSTSSCMMIGTTFSDSGSGNSGSSECVPKCALNEWENTSKDVWWERCARACRCRSQQFTSVEQ
eukprot:12887433-Prorocentrum_lima.AAC.1